MGPVFCGCRGDGLRHQLPCQIPKGGRDDKDMGAELCRQRETEWPVAAGQCTPHPEENYAWDPAGHHMLA